MGAKDSGRRALYAAGSIHFWRLEIEGADQDIDCRRRRRGKAGGISGDTIRGGTRGSNGQYSSRGTIAGRVDWQEWTQGEK